MRRVLSVDKYIEECFGKPDYSRRVADSGEWLIPMGTEKKLWRVEPILVFPKIERRMRGVKSVQPSES